VRTGKRPPVVQHQRGGRAARPPQPVFRLQQRNPTRVDIRKNRTVVAGHGDGRRTFQCKFDTPCGGQNELVVRCAHGGDIAQQVRRIEHAKLFGMKPHRIAGIAVARVEPLRHAPDAVELFGQWPERLCRPR